MLFRFFNLTNFYFFIIFIIITFYLYFHWIWCVFFVSVSFTLMLFWYSFEYQSFKRKSFAQTFRKTLKSVHVFRIFELAISNYSVAEWYLWHDASLLSLHPLLSILPTAAIVDVHPFLILFMWMSLRNMYTEIQTVFYGNIISVLSSNQEMKQQCDYVIHTIDTEKWKWRRERERAAFTYEMWMHLMDPYWIIYKIYLIIHNLFLQTFFFWRNPFDLFILFYFGYIVSYKLYVCILDHNYQVGYGTLKKFWP